MILCLLQLERCQHLPTHSSAGLLADRRFLSSLSILNLPRVSFKRLMEKLHRCKEHFTRPTCLP